MKNKILYIAIIILAIIVLLQNRSCYRKPEIIEKRDTVIVYDTVKLVIPGETKYIKTKIDTSVWIKKADLKPDTTYNGLLKQYVSLGNKYYSTNVFKTDFKVADYGYLTITDSVRNNWLINSTLETNLTIPTTTITIEKQAPPKMQLFVGTSFTGNKYDLINGVYGDLALKTKKDKIYEFSVGYTGEINYKIGLKWPLKLRK